MQTASSVFIVDRYDTFFPVGMFKLHPSFILCLISYLERNTQASPRLKLGEKLQISLLLSNVFLSSSAGEFKFILNCRVNKTYKHIEGNKRKFPFI